MKGSCRGEFGIFVTYCDTASDQVKAFSANATGASAVHDVVLIDSTKSPDEPELFVALAPSISPLCVGRIGAGRDPLLLMSRPRSTSPNVQAKIRFSTCPDRGRHSRALLRRLKGYELNFGHPL